MINCFLIDTATLETGIVTTILGFAVVFFILCMISFVLVLFGKVMKNPSSKKDKPAITIPKSEPAPIVKEEPKDELMDDKELIAVITAAIAASMGGSTSPDKLVVKSLKRVKSSSWKNRAIYEQQISDF